MRAYEDPEEPIPVDLNANAMALWHQAHQGKYDANWDSWLSATYGVYEQVIPHIDVAATPWWTEVLRTVEQDGVPAHVYGAVEILDAMARRDGPRLWAALEPTWDDLQHPLPLSMRALAGLVALELQGIPAAQRQAFVEERMSAFGKDGQSSDFGYQVLQAYGARP